jgi:hypothetical protein
MGCYRGIYIKLWAIFIQLWFTFCIDISYNILNHRVFKYLGSSNIWFMKLDKICVLAHGPCTALMTHSLWILYCRKELRRRGLNTQGKKVDLVNRLRSWLEVIVIFIDSIWSFLPREKKFNILSLNCLTRWLQVPRKGLWYSRVDSLGLPYCAGHQYWLLRSAGEWGGGGSRQPQQLTRQESQISPASASNINHNNFL